MTHDFLGKALEVWRLRFPEIVVDCIEMDSVLQERALHEGRISVGILVPSDRPVGGVWGGCRQSFQNSSACWRKSVPVETPGIEKSFE